MGGDVVAPVPRVERSRVCSFTIQVEHDIPFRNPATPKPVLEVDAMSAGIEADVIEETISWRQRLVKTRTLLVPDSIIRKDIVADLDSFI